MDRMRRKVVHSAWLATVSAAFPHAGDCATKPGHTAALEIPPVLAALWKLTGGDPATSERAALAFDDAGLIMVAPPEWYGYTSTPLNSVTFAHTGGDGVHFGWLTVEGIEPGNSPVVMTVPAGPEDRQNIIVGSSILDFLHLGCCYGYFPLDGLAYHWNDTVEELELRTVDPEAWPAKRRQLEILAKHFQLQPWPDPRNRLPELQEQFAPTIRLPSDSNCWRSPKIDHLFPEMRVEN